MLLVDDDPLVRAGLAMIIATATDMQVVGEAGDGEEAIDEVRTHRPDVVLMDILMPNLDGIRATALVRTLPQAPEVLVLTTIAADAYVLDALRAGASGFLLKDTPPAAIVAAVRQVADGVPSLSPTVARTVIAHVAREGGAERQAAARATLGELSDREREVAIQVGRGLSNAEIGGVGV